MNLIKKTLLGLAATAALIIPAQASTLKEITESTYRLHADGRGICSTQAVSPTQLVTAYHCIDDKTAEFSVVVPKTLGPDKEWEKVSENTLFVKVIRGIKDKDIALLELKDADAKLPNYVDIAKVETVEKHLTIGTDLIAVTYPMVTDLTVTDGKFTGHVKAPNGVDEIKKGLYKTTVPVTGGSSGGGLYMQDGMETDENDFMTPRYVLIGTTTGGYQHVDFMTYFSTIYALQDVTKSLLILPSEDKTNGEEAIKCEAPPGLACPTDEEVKKDMRDVDEPLINPSDEK